MGPGDAATFAPACRARADVEVGAPAVRVFGGAAPIEVALPRELETLKGWRG
jgi:hypothetical protein